MAESFLAPRSLRRRVVLNAWVLGIEPKFLQPKLNPNTETRCIHSGYEPAAGKQGARANA